MTGFIMNTLWLTVLLAISAEGVMADSAELHTTDLHGADERTGGPLQTDGGLQTAHSSLVKTEVSAPSGPENFVETTVELQTAQSGFYDHYPGSNHLGGRGGHYDGYGNNHHRNLGHRHHLGHRHANSHYGSTGGSYGNGNDLDYFGKGGAYHKGRDFDKHQAAVHNVADVGSEGLHHGSKAHSNKGHKDKGYKNVQHKEEYGYTKVFGNDANKNQYHSAHHDHDGHHKFKKNGAFGGNRYLNDHHHNKYGSKGADEHGRYHDDHRTATGGFGKAGKYGVKDGYGTVGGHGFGQHGHGLHRPHDNGWRGFNRHVNTPLYNGHLSAFNGHGNGYRHGSPLLSGYGHGHGHGRFRNGFGRGRPYGY